MYFFIIYYNKYDLIYSKLFDNKNSVISNYKKLIEKIKEKYKNIEITKIEIKENTIEKFVRFDNKMRKKEHKILINLYKFMEKLGGDNNNFFHFSPVKIDFYNKKYDKKSILPEWCCYNPNGFWFSCGIEWLKYKILNQQRYNSQIINDHYRYIYQVKISENTKIKKIKNKIEFIDFFNKFRNKNPKNIGDFIKWDKIYKKYDGLIICPYINFDNTLLYSENINNYFNSGNYEEYINHSNYNKIIKLFISQLNNKISIDLFKNKKFYHLFCREWYRNWEIASGVIWRIKDNITLIEIGKYSHSKNKFISSQ